LIKEARRHRTLHKAAQQAVPLTLDELHLYKKLTALHSVNGGELFAI
jgi:hypothetical protein